LKVIRSKMRPEPDRTPLASGLRAGAVKPELGNLF